jgi:hypothetical protein
MIPNANAAPNPASFQSNPSPLEATGPVEGDGTAQAPISPSFSRMIACCD